MKQETSTAMQWYVLVVRPNTEKSAAKKLAKAGFKVLCPTRKTLRQWSDRKKKVDEVLFRNYIFVCTTPAARKAVFEVAPKQLIRYLRHDGAFATLRPREVEVLERLAGLRQPDSVRLSYAQPPRGTQLCIEKGPLKGLTGEVLDAQGSQVLLRVESLGAVVWVEG
jgi:transcription antitermination factor NusG